MTWLQSIFLGFIQGVTEFLPVSSSGHLVIFQELFQVSSQGILFEVVLHLATLGAILVFFRDRLLKLSVQDFKLLAIGTLPIVIVGLLFKNQIEALFVQPVFVAIALIVTGLLNLVIHFKVRQELSSKQKDQKPEPAPTISTAQVLLAGVFQAVAVVPGISRSGSTITGAMQAGLKRKEAFEWSFLLGIPAIMGAAVLQLRDMASHQVVLENPVTLLLGSLAAFVTGLLSLKVLEWMLAKAQVIWFALYCWVVGVGYLILFIT